ncbi:cobalamin biosynthesis protein [Actinoplanes sp. NPDC051859]|uniref:cobalamin biosynthesis protein n=1 Tax=Actinoplanes sp. NPDC051859 TaxID=3363909 RepID=UPI0037A47F44
MITPPSAAEPAALPGVVVGIGVRPGVPAAVVDAAVDAALLRAGLSAAQVVAAATLDRRAAQLAPVVEARAWPLLALAPDRLVEAGTPHPSDRVAELAGVPSVAEAAALVGAGPGAYLLLPKQIIGPVTVAIAHRP